jgi:cell wall-associated NlpC family hydrolase
MTTARTSTTRTSTARRFVPLVRRSLVAVLAGAGVMLTPLPASAHVIAPPPAAAPPASVAAPNHAAQVVVDTAMAQLGKPYVWGAAGPSSFDCSGLSLYAYSAIGVRLPHSAAMQSTMGTPVSQASLLPGDLVFFYSPVGHVGVYIGNGQIVHSPTEGDVVKVSDIAYMGLYAGARRLT